MPQDPAPPGAQTDDDNGVAPVSDLFQVQQPNAEAPTDAVLSDPSQARQPTQQPDAEATDEDDDGVVLSDPSRARQPAQQQPRRRGPTNDKVRWLLSRQLCAQKKLLQGLDRSRDYVRLAMRCRRTRW